MDVETLNVGAEHALPLPLDVPFTSRVAGLAGLTPNRLTELCAARVIRRVLRGVYVGAAVPDSLDLRASCLRLVVPEDAVVVDRHAGWLLGAQMVLAPNDHLAARPISMFRPSGSDRIRRDMVVSGERMLTDEDVVEVGGLRVTTPTRTAWDLGRVRWADEAIAGIDAMLRLGVSRDELLAGVERFRGFRWITTLRTIAPLADGRSESPGESVLRLRCVENGLEMVPQINVRRDGRVVARLDLANERLRIAAEYDGVEWHSTPDQQGRDLRRRQDLAADGWDVEALGKDLVFGPARGCDRVLRQLGQRGQSRYSRHVA